MPPKRKGSEETPEENRRGDGGVYPDKARGGWRWSVPLGHGRTKSGRRMERADAVADWQAALDQRDRNLKPQGTSLTLADLAREYRERIVTARQSSNKPFSPNTLLDLQKIQKYMLGSWGNYRIKEFDAQLVLDFHSDLTKKHSAYIAKRVLTHMHQLFNFAIIWGYLDKNIVAIARPTIPTYATEDKDPMPVAEAQRLIAYVVGTKHFLLYLVALVYGMRVGELLALRWEDIDWGTRTIHVRRQVLEIKGHKIVREQTKTKAGDRILPLTLRVESLLRDAPRTSEYIFPSRNGTVWLPSDFRRHFHGSEGEGIVGLRQKAGLSEKVTPHIFRHTVATRLVDINVRGEISDGILGHGKKGIRGRYGHATLETMREALTTIENQLLEGLA